MIQRGSLLRRLITWQSATLAVTLAIFSIILFSITARRLSQHHDDALVRVCREARRVVDRMSPLGEDDVDALGRTFRNMGHGVSFEVLDPGDGVTSTVEAAPIQLETRQPSEPIPGHEGGLRIASTRFVARDGTAYHVEAREPLGDMRTTLASIRVVVVAITPLVFLLAIGVGALILWSALRPLRTMVRWAGEIDVNRLGDRLEIANAPSEIEVLADAFNQMTSRLASSFERVQEFSANASHELRTPLTSMTSSLDVTLQRERSAEEYRRVLGQLLDETVRLSRIVENLLVLAQTDTGTVELRREPIDLGTLLLESLDATHARSMERGVTVELEELDAEPIVGDPGWLRQLFDNLIDNAIKYSNRGGKVRVGAEVTRGDARIVVSDEGIGIPEEEQARIFDRFQRVESGQDDGRSGVGLGLAIALWVAEMHKGRILVEAEEGRGSTFKVILPRLESPPRA